MVANVSKIVGDSSDIGNWPGRKFASEPPNVRETVLSVSVSVSV